MLRRKLNESKNFFTKDKYKTCISLAEMLFEQNNLKASKEILDKLPTKDILLEQLISKLKGKSVYKTLKKINEKNADVFTKFKGTSSLITHCIIEMEKGNREFGILLPSLVDKEKELLKSL